MQRVIELAGRHCLVCRVRWLRIVLSQVRLNLKLFYQNFHLHDFQLLKIYLGFAAGECMVFMQNVKINTHIYLCTPTKEASPP